MSFLLHPGLGLPVWLPVLASSLGSGLGMDSPVVCVVDEDCPRALHHAWSFQDGTISVLTPNSLHS